MIFTVTVLKLPSDEKYSSYNDLSFGEKYELRTERTSRMIVQANS